MALLDFLKNKKERDKTAKKLSEVKVEKKQEKKIEKQPSKSVSHISTGKNFAFETIKQPHISEKASYLAETNQYVFEILQGKNKNEIKKAVEGIYGVDVLSVNIIKIPAKKRRIGKTQGYRKGFLKAVVKIKEDQKIEIL
jgi:large subunit ribosomal protein L23